MPGPTPETLAAALERAAGALPPPGDAEAARIARRLRAAVTLGVAGASGPERAAIVALMGSLPGVVTTVHDPGDASIVEADIVLLCLTGGDSAAVDARDMLPPSCRNRAFVLLTGAGDLGWAGRIEGDLADLATALGPEVAGLFPIAAQHAFRGRQQADPAAFRASGGEALLSAVGQAIQRGREGLCDAAALFLHRYGFATDDPSLRPAADPVPRPVTPAPSVAAPWQDATSLSLAFDPTALADRDRIRGVLDHVAGAADHLAEALPDWAGPPLAEEIRHFADTARLLRAERSAAAAAEALMILAQIGDDLAQARPDCAGGQP